MRDNKLYLICASEAIERIESYTSGGRDMFMASTLIQDAVLRNLYMLGSAAEKLSGGIKSTHHGARWADMGKFHREVMPNYLSLDMDKVWDVVENYLPTLKPAIPAMLQEIEGAL